ncbi:ATP-dependent Clp protease proteolytic subunit-related protein, partial [Drosera capensis]
MAAATATASFSSPMTPRATLTSPLSSFPGRRTHSPPFSPLAKSRVRKLYMAPSAKKSPLDRIPKQFRVENLPDGVKEHYKKAPSFFHGFGPSQMANFTDDNEETILSAGSYLEDQKIGNTVNSSLGASSLDMTSYDHSATPEIPPESPDFRNFALNCRILFLDMPIVSAVTELIASQIMWLRFEDYTKPIHMYIDSTGTQDSEGEPFGNEMQAYALAEMMLMFDDVYTVNMSRAFGQAAMLLSIGKKGHRGTFPSARTRFHLPKVPGYSG